MKVESGKRSRSDLRALWPNMDAFHREIVLYLSYLPSPVVIDHLVELSDTPAVTVLNAMGKLEARGLVNEKRRYGRGVYFPRDDLRSSFRDGEIWTEESRRAARKIIDSYDRRDDQLTDDEAIMLAELLRRLGDYGKGLTIIKQAARILSLRGQDEEARLNYDYLIECLSARTATRKDAEDLVDSILGGISFALYHFSVDRQIALLTIARGAARQHELWDRLARAEIALSWALQTAGEHAEASRSLANFRRLAAKIGDPKLLKPAAVSICEVFLRKGMLSEVIRFYEATTGSLEEFGDDDSTLKAAALVGWTFVICGRPARGMGMIGAVRAKAEALGFHQVVIYADICAMMAFFDVKRIHEAEPIVLRLLSTSEEKVGHIMFPGVNDSMAYILCSRGDMEGARRYHEKSCKHARAVGSRYHPSSWIFEHLAILESKGIIDETVNCDTDIRAFLAGDNLYMKGVAYRYRAIRNAEKGNSSGTILTDLRASERRLKKSGAIVELARTWIALGRHHLEEKDEKTALSYIEKAWAALSRIDRNLFPQDLLAILPEEQKTPVVLERIAEINQTLGTIQNKDTFLEKVIDVAIDATMATRASFVAPTGEGRYTAIASRNLDLSVLDKNSIQSMADLIGEVARRRKEIIFPALEDTASDYEGRRSSEELFLQAGIRSFLGMPASMGDRNYGYLCLDNRLENAPFSQNQCSFIRFLCSQIALGLSNIETYEEMKELKSRFEEETIFYKKEMGLTAPIETIIGRSEAIGHVLEAIRHVAPTTSTVLITGETGVGKELVAKAIHNLSSRKAGPFIPINLAAISEGLVGSELFGHEKGAFTGAHDRRKGRFELADGGTLFLDEIGDLPLSMQVKLLRVLQEGAFERLGGSQQIRSDFRLVAATNKDLPQEVKNGAFRQDLYYRLSVFPIRVPPLRERREDIPVLVKHFVEKFARKLGKKVVRVRHEEMDKLVRRAWPGNVRELEHCIEQALILFDGTILNFPDTNSSDNQTAPQKDFELMALADMERDYIKKVLDITHGRVMGPGGAASILSIKATTLFSRIKKLGIERQKSPFRQHVNK